STRPRKTSYPCHLSERGHDDDLARNPCPHERSGNGAHEWGLEHNRPQGNARVRTRGLRQVPPIVLLATLRGSVCGAAPGVLFGGMPRAFDREVREAGQRWLARRARHPDGSPRSWAFGIDTATGRGIDLRMRAPSELVACVLRGGTPFLIRNGDGPRWPYRR